MQLQSFFTLQLHPFVRAGARQPEHRRFAVASREGHPRPAMHSTLSPPDMLLLFRPPPSYELLLQAACWELLRSHLGLCLAPCMTLRLVQRPGMSGNAGMVHVDVQLEREGEEAEEDTELWADGSASQQQQDSGHGASQLDSQGGEQHDYQAAGVDGPAPRSLRTAGSEGAAAILAGLQALPAAAPAAAAGAAVPPDLSALLAAMTPPAMPTAKGAKRLVTGRDGKGDRRARLTFKKKSYYAGSFADGRTAAQAEDLMAIWVQGTAHGWQEGWMQGG